MPLLQLAANNIEKATPMLVPKENIFNKKGDVKQTKELSKLIVKNASRYATGAGNAVYVLRIESSEVNMFGSVVYLSYNGFTDKIELHTSN